MSYGERVQTSRNGDGAFSLVDEAVDLEREFVSDYCDYVRRWKETEDFIYHLKDHGQIKVILERYIDEKSLASIAEDWGKSFERVRCLHWQGMKKLQELLDEYGQPDAIPEGIAI